MAFKSGTTLADAVDVITNYASLGSRAFSPASSQTLSATEVKITASDGAANDTFGTSVAVGSGRIVVGAWQDDDNGAVSGSAYIFDLNGTQLAKFTPSDGAAVDYFGWSAAVGSGRIVVGAYGDDDNGSFSGSAYIFDLDGNQIAKITASDGAADDQFGYSVAVGCGRVVVGARFDDDNGSNSGSAYIFDLDGNQLAKITASDAAAGDLFGESVAVGSGRIVVGARLDDDNGSSSGSAYIYDLDGNQIAKITASDGAAGDYFGISVAVGSNRIVVGASYEENFAGAAYVFDLDGNQIAKVTSSPRNGFTFFGSPVAVGSDRIIVGYNGDSGYKGSAYVYDLNGTQLAKITASDGATADYFGGSVAVRSGRIVVGASGDDDNGNSSGSAYIYDFGQNYDSYIEDVLDVKQI